MSTDLLKIQSLPDFIKTFIIYQICVFVMVSCSLLRLKIRECNSQKCDVNFQKNLCHYSENRLSLSFSMVVRVYVAIMHECQTRTNHAITDLYHYNQPTSPRSRDKWCLTLATLLKMV